MLNIFTRLFGSRNQRLLRQYAERVRLANQFADALAAESAEGLRARTDTLRARLVAGETLDAILPEAFATAREAASRSVGMRPFDVQLVGGMVLHEGNISEMRTGEGKTLVATLPVYLNALAGKGVHVVTVNEYLAQRDAEWMGPVYRLLGLSVGVITSGQPQAEKRAAYACDVTYGTNNEFGFDYLRDNLAARLEDRVQRGQPFAIVDEVDSILIDEARTPLIISGPAEESTELYAKIDALVPRFVRQAAEEGEGDFFADEKSRQVHLSESGFEKAEALMQEAGLLREGDSLYDPASIRLLHHLNAALRAHVLYHRDVEYIVRGADVIIVDEFTGRTMPGRRWSDGLHQAVEAKEGVRIREENQTIASITFQNYFRLYEKLAGMTGTADTEAFEFQQIYGLEVVVVPTHRPMVRKDMSDLVYLNQSDKFDAIIEDIRDCVKRGQPVLVGTTSIETSEKLSGHLKKSDIAHAVLNAKQHEREAMIIAQAGRPAAVTIATNMAGRGTDIVLGGNVERQVDQLRKDGVMSEEQLAGRARELENEWTELHGKVIEAGGLHIIGTERHESRRIDNQLRGRSGRQGDPGSSRFYLSLEDNLMRIFGDPERTKSLLKTVGMKEGEAIESGMLTRQIERAQRKVESHNFDARKNLLEYDDVANDQRKVIYRQRTEIMSTDDIGGVIKDVRAEVVGNLVWRLHAAGQRRGTVGRGRARGGVPPRLRRGHRPRGLAHGGPVTPRRGSLGALPRGHRGCLRGKDPAGRRAGHAPPRARRDAAAARHALARAPRRDGLPAPGHLPARLRPEESQAGVQARGVRAVHRDARPHPLRHGDAAAAPAGPHRGRDRARGGGAPAPPAEPHATAARGAARTRGPGAGRRRGGCPGR